MKTKVTQEKKLLKTHTRISGLIFKEKRTQYLFLYDFIAFLQINSLHSDDHSIHQDLESSCHDLFIPVSFWTGKS
jgi:hypothetical protein